MKNERGEAQQLVRLAERELLEAANQLRAIRGYPPLGELPQPPFCSFCFRTESESGALVGSDPPTCAECAEEVQRLRSKRGT